MCGLRFRLSALFAALVIWCALSALCPAIGRRFGPAGTAQAQIEAPDRKFVFIEDKDKKEKEALRRRQLREKRKRIRSQRQGPSNLPFDINANSLRYDSVNDVVQAEGNVIIGYAASIIEADKGSFGVKSRDAALSGDVRISDPEVTLSASEAQLNLDSGQGQLRDTQLSFVDGDYEVGAKAMRKVGPDDYEFDDADLTTCHCPEPGDCPWRLRAPRGYITREGYGSVYNATLEVNDIPMLYMPYLFFPVKTERQSGLLPASFGTGKETGFELSQPLFLALDESTDATVTGVVQTKTRWGSDLEFRKLFSLNHKLDMGLTYLNENWRNGALQGTNIQGLADPTIDRERYAGYWHESWRHNVEGRRLQMIVDGNYVSDDLFLREFERPKIAEFNDRFVTSDVVLRSSLWDTYSVELSSEYNQAMVDDDDFIFQRLPEASLNGFNVFRPFGENAYGAKFVLTSDAQAANFMRRSGYDGRRGEVFEQIKLPFHYMNYFDAEIAGEGRVTQYSLDETAEVQNDAEGNEQVVGELPSSSSRALPALSGKMSTVFERVFEVPQDSRLKEIAELGTIGRKEELRRLKHTIEPTVRYRLVPYVDQTENPQFDSRDRLAQRNVVTYGVVQRLYARYEPRDEYLYGVEEATPELEDLSQLSAAGPLDNAFNFGFDRDVDTPYQGLRRGSRRELVNLGISQSYDLLSDDSNRAPGQSPASDVGISMKLLPNDHVRFGIGTNYDAENSNFSSYSLSTQLIDKRGDELRSQLTFIDNQPNSGDEPVRQLETALQVALTDRVKLGYYARYDDIAGQFIEDNAGIRVNSECKCWVFDVGLSDRVNPNQTRITFNITLLGLGGFGDSLFSFKDKTGDTAN